MRARQKESFDGLATVTSHYTTDRRGVDLVAALATCLDCLNGQHQMQFVTVRLGRKLKGDRSAGTRSIQRWDAQVIFLQKAS